MKKKKKLEQTYGIFNAKDFIDEIVNPLDKTLINNQGKCPKWNSYTKIQEVIENVCPGRFEFIITICLVSKIIGKKNKNIKSLLL